MAPPRRRAALAAFALSGGAPKATWPPSASIGHRLRALQKPYRRVQARAGLLRPRASGSHLVCQASEPQVFRQRTLRVPVATRGGVGGCEGAWSALVTRHGPKHAGQNYPHITECTRFSSRNAGLPTAQLAAFATHKSTARAREIAGGVERRGGGGAGGGCHEGLGRRPRIEEELELLLILPLEFLPIER